ncbi:MAG TPA: tripartite tricarboxylate transporter substrate binding protein [Burkholderiales bacterium]|nr:tripartite tricarboxylate transporter substrate binding protein [Burkholderiales bacterium]
MRLASGNALSAVLGAFIVSAIPGVSAQDAYPSRPVRIIVPSGAGAGNDAISRMIAQRLTERWGRSVVVENRTGAGTVIGSDVVAKAAPDGYTLLMTPSTLAINPATYKHMPYDGIRDFAPITHVASVPNLMVVHPSLPVRSVRDMIALAKAHPGEILYASAGHGTNPHLTMALFASMANVRMIHVPYKGGPPGVIELIAGRVAVMATSLNYLLPHVRSGRLRGLGVTSARRAAAAPEFPTIAEAGVPGYESVQWYGMLAPARTPRHIIDKLHEEVTAFLRSPDTHERLTKDGNEVVASTPEAFAAFIKAETLKWAKVVKAAGIEPE